MSNPHGPNKPGPSLPSTTLAGGHGQHGPLPAGPAGQPPAGYAGATGQPAHAGQPHAGQPHAGQPPAGHPHAGQPYAGQRYAGQPYAGHAHAGQPYAGQPHAGQPYAGQPPYVGQAPLPSAVASYPAGAPAAGTGQGTFAPSGPPPAGGAPQVVPLSAPAEAGMFKRALGRAFRLRIEPNEISPAEARALTSASPPITEPHLQAFLAWRRSVLFLVALALVPLTVLRFVAAYADGMPPQLRFIELIPAVAEALLCLVCWYQLKHWMSWRRQRRALFRAWLLFMAAPFLVFLIPMDPIIEEVIRSQLGGEAVLGLDEAGAGVAAAATTVKVLISVAALLTLAPKAVSLLAGTIRAGIVTKMLFPGTAGPGWLVVLATPLYALFVFTLLIVPYQLTGSGWYFGAMLALTAAQVAIGRAGYALARPTTHDEAVRLVGRARGAYLLSMLAFAVCMIVALGSLAGELGVSAVITTALSFETNVLLLTLIGSDLVITSLARARGLTSGSAHLVEESNQQLTAFVGET